MNTEEIKKHKKFERTVRSLPEEDREILYLSAMTLKLRNDIHLKNTTKEENDVK